MLFRKDKAPENAMMVIFPYKWPGMKTWVFDDRTKKLKAEPFVMGIPAMIDRLIELTDTKGDRVRFIFSRGEFPGYHASLRKIKNESNGAWYEINKSTVGEIKLPPGWLCPATKKYFPTMPDYIYVRVEQII